MTRHRLGDVDEPGPLLVDDDAPVPPARRPTWWRVRRVRAIAFVCVGLTVAISLASGFVSWRTAQHSAAEATAVERRLSVLEDDLAERAQQRDAERDAAAAQAAEDREQFRARLCEVLGELSATFPNLDRLLDALECPPPAAAPASTSAPENLEVFPPADTSRPPTGSGSTTPEPDPPADPGPAPAAPDQPEPPDPDRGPVGDLLCSLVRC